MTLVSEHSAARPGPARADLARPAARPVGGVGGAQGILPAEAEFILSALEAGQHSCGDGRKSGRTQYHKPASLKLYSDDPQAPPWHVYVRDIGPQGLGFITRHRLPLGYGGILTIVTPQGKTVRVDCTLLRCREAVQGWFEGGMYFNRHQPCFAADAFPR